MRERSEPLNIRIVSLFHSSEMLADLLSTTKVNALLANLSVDTVGQCFDVMS